MASRIFPFISGLLAVLYVREVRSEWMCRKCCEYAVEDDCRRVCLQSNSMDMLTLHCTEDTETDLFGCLSRHQNRKRCCGKSTNMTMTCQHVCATSFRAEFGPSEENLLEMERNCPANVVECTKNFSLSTRRPSVEGIMCCDKSNSERCRNGCKEVLKQAISDTEKLELLVRKCGDPIPREPMWKCLLYAEGEYPRPAAPRVGPELQCCSKAISASCRQLCKKLYSRPWESSSKWQYFQHWCEYNSEETDLNTCLREVREPCKMGCNGLDFCSSFNNRPTESFHSCSARADNLARSQISEWKKGTILLPVAEIPVLDIETCQPKKWHAIACALEVKPCSTKMAGTIICHEDCIALLRECADISRFDPGMTIQWLCDVFSPNHLQDECLSLDNYMTSSGRSGDVSTITQPCHPDPCEEGEVCVVDRTKCKRTHKCPYYKCLQGCKVGDVGDAFVHVGQRVKLPDFARGDGCYRACACTSTGKLQYCSDLPCMDGTKPCTIVGQVKVHGSHFKIDCNFCSCYNGKVMCTKRQCLPTDKSDHNNRDFTGLPCNCDRHFLPVCAPNGQTYPSVCLARCMGHDETNISFGPCKAKDPCKSKPCKRNEICVKASRVCISSSSVTGCPQYECVAPYLRCLERRMTRDAYASDGHHYVNHKRLNSASKRNIVPALFLGYGVDWEKQEPVCDTDGVEHHNICYLRKRHRSAQLAYRGKCRKHCDKNSDSPVCGQNIVTYENECAALAQRVLIDYKAACRTVNVQRDGLAEAGSCTGVTCKKLAHPECEPVTPPGACCPVCGGMLRVLFSQNHVDAISKSSIHGPVTIRDVLRSLRRHINVRECDAYSHLTIEDDIAVLVVPTVARPTLLQIEACLREAERFARLINERSPLFNSDVILSTLKAAEVHGKKNTGNSAAHIRRNIKGMTCLSVILKNVITIFGVSETCLAGTSWIANFFVLHFLLTKVVYPVG